MQIMTSFSKTFIYSVMLLTFSFIYSQNSSLKGIVIDGKTGQPITGAKVALKENKKSQFTNYEGNFVFSNITIGRYTIEVSASSFQTKEITEIDVVADDITNLTISLDGKENVLGEVIITSKAKLESVKSLLVMQKNSANVSDGISAETIKRTPDKNTSDVLKRISGASIQDNRFVIVRGLNDRYNFALLNNSPLPSSEPDRKAFSFDIFPSNMLDNIMITKTASPDLPGEFAGGVVQITTKAVPEKDFQSLTVGAGYNSITTFKDQRTYKGSSTDWLGFDNGTRALPSSIPSTEVMQGTDHELPNLQVAKSFQSDWLINDSKFKPNSTFQYAIGRHYDLGDKKLGMLFSFTHNITNNFNEISRNSFTSPGNLNSSYNDNNYSQQVLTGALGNFSLKFNENNTITFKNILSVNSTDLVVERSGQADVTNTFVTNSNVRWFTSNKIYSGQLNGDHYFTQPKIKVLWNGFYSNIQRAIPNLRRNSYTLDTDPNGNNPFVPILNIATNEAGSNNYAGAMFFSENKESIYGGRLDISKKFNLSENSINEFKIGAFIQNRNRSFYSRTFYYFLYDPFNTQPGLLSQPESTVFSAPNFSTTGFSIFEQTQDKDAYNATSSLNSAYAMMDNRYNKFRLVWGVRLEDYTQTLTTKYQNIELNNKQLDVLPSANFIFSINKDQNLRLSYSKTVNRPEFRELAPFAFYDFTTQFLTEGNPDLKIATVQNLDLRYEIYPGKGQLFSISYFRKNFTNPIELKQATNKNIKYVNADSAVNSGVELEFRTLLSSIFKSEKTTVFDDLTLFSNIAVIQSKVDISSFNETETSRPMQGQSPYVFNAGLQYMNKENGWVVSTNINRVGDRIAISGNDNEPSIWEKSRTFLDMQIAKSFKKNTFEIKLNVQNVLAQDLIFYQNNQSNQDNTVSAIDGLFNSVFTGDRFNNNGYNKDVDDAIWVTKFGRTFSLSMSYNF
jgi:TonB-dependent receptor